MNRVQAILEQARGLSGEEISQLIAALEEHSALDPDVDEIRSGKRGLAALTESTRDEDWSAYYPDRLRHGD